MSAQTDDDRAHRLATIRDRISAETDRREFLRTVVNAGYALGLARLLGVDDFLAVDDGDVPIVTALRRDDPDDPTTLEERTEAVPAEWYSSVTKAFEMHSVVAETEIPGYLASAVEPGDYASGTAGISIGVSAEDLENATEELDALIEDVSFSVDAIEGVEELEEGPGPGDNEPQLIDADRGPQVPGGVTCETSEPATATLAPALHHPDRDEPLFATAHHAYMSFDDPVDEPLYLVHPDEAGRQVELGTVRYAHEVEDVVGVEPTGDFRPVSRIQGATPERVSGQYTRLGLAALAARDEPLEKVGSMTGHTTGRIVGVDAVTCLTNDSCRPGQLKWGSEGSFTDGDSGSVSYHPDPLAPDEGVLVAGLNNARTWWPGQDYIWGTAAYRLTDEYGYHF